VLDGATALALPTRLGQSLSVHQTNEIGLHWKSELVDGSTWFETVFDINDLRKGILPKKEGVVKTLANILATAMRLNPNFLRETVSIGTTSLLEFSRTWGLGSSSTLISNIALWAEVDPYLLLRETFGGSGYDIACAQAKGPITFYLENEQAFAKAVTFKPTFSDQLFFIHLNQKQNSRESIAHYKNVIRIALKQHAEKISGITNGVLECRDIHSFEQLLKEHEQYLSNLLQIPTIQQSTFQDYPRVIKSLGGWGGDFVLATGGKEEIIFFKERGYTTILSYKDMIL